MSLTLPDGPRAGRLAQTVALHRDPLGFLRAQQARFGDVFTLRLLTAGPVVVLASRAAAEALPGTDGAGSHAGEARLGMLPMASPDSVFGGDGERHRAARGRIEAAFSAEAAAERAPAMRRIAEAHVARWPRRRPFRLLPRMRALADEIFVREILGIEARAGALAPAIGRMLYTPGNPPVTVPARDDGLAGRLVGAEYRRRRARVARVLEAEIAERRAAGEPGRGVLGLALADEPDAPAEGIVEELLAVLMAAQEPMAAALTWITLHLAKDEDLYDRGLDEELVTESLRLNPSALGVLRKLTEPMHGLPAGASTMVPIPLVQRDPRDWEAPDAFRPGRPATGALLPFGGGPRACIGREVARAEIGEVLPAVLRARRLRVPGGDVERMVLRATILVPQRSGLVLDRT
jgi:cytochrome P450 family 135